MKPAIKSEQDKERQPLLGQKPTTTIVSSENKTRSTANVTDDDDADSAGDDGKSSILITAFCLMLIFQLGNRIFGKLQTVNECVYLLFSCHNSFRSSYITVSYAQLSSFLESFIYCDLCAPQFLVYSSYAMVLQQHHEGANGSP
jgi:hypothetical protein